MTQGEKYLNCEHIPRGAFGVGHIHQIIYKTGRKLHIPKTAYGPAQVLDEEGTIKLRLCNECNKDFLETLELDSQGYESRWKMELSENLKKWKRRR